MRAVFDLDDTISIHKNRDYPNAIPIISTVEKMRKMKEDGWEIIIYTARGQVSCNGDISLIEERNRPVVEEWLRKNCVPYDALVFGKPLGDLYVDDKGVSLREFLDEPFEMLYGGGSGKTIYRVGNTVKKEFGSTEETQAFKTWMENNDVFKVPKVHSYLYNAVYMDYIDGENASRVNAAFTPWLIDLCEECRKNHVESFDLKPHIERLQQNYTDNSEANQLIEAVTSYLQSENSDLKHMGSFCHGDMILSNIIIKEGSPYFLDARYTPNANSYLLDLAKLRMSLSGYERIFGISSVDNSRHTKTIDQYCDFHGITDIVKAFEIMFIFRCYRYKNDDDKKKIIDFALSEARNWRRR